MWSNVRSMVRISRPRRGDQKSTFQWDAMLQHCIRIRYVDAAVAAVCASRRKSRSSPQPSARKRLIGTALSGQPKGRALAPAGQSVQNAASLEGLFEPAFRGQSGGQARPTGLQGRNGGDWPAASRKAAVDSSGSRRRSCPASGLTHLARHFIRPPPPRESRSPPAQFPCKRSEAPVVARGLGNGDAADSRPRRQAMIAVRT
jgi:hypothetical protein